MRNFRRTTDANARIFSCDWTLVLGRKSREGEGEGMLAEVLG